MSNKEKLEMYWKENLKVIFFLLVVWFVVSYLFGILMADALDSIKIAGFKLGFWFANQGSEVIFVILIYIYVVWMNAIDKKYDVHEE
ncbi:DUF4212 domain-containing protein [Calditerrivibrio nitroreducens]|uniref:Putative solute symporter protein n=1 Tax=Calditerrivibrio nitroreducens (strain DSM 19672 / NBRC 101217 / Yu37-1) TaxID=768670 RepID=E4TEY8_CALNY|nr:DUF4212 domain-containing protein [Calditerrivibrio nitroreducens]ADR18394.1 putative solute symporter protein [Calditerrivibrio nitroreducens DSM 19672]